MDRRLLGNDPSGRVCASRIFATADRKTRRKLISSGVVEGLIDKAKVTIRKSYGFQRALLALLKTLQVAPLPADTMHHRAVEYMSTSARGGRTGTSTSGKDRH